MPYKKLSDVPAALKSALRGDLRLINVWARYYDDAKKAGEANPAAIAWTRFKKKYRLDKEKNKWVPAKRVSEMSKSELWDYIREMADVLINEEIHD